MGALEVIVPLDASSSGESYTYDATQRTLEVKLTKAVPGTHFPGLEELRPQLLSDVEMHAFERDAERMQHEEQTTSTESTSSGPTTNASKPTYPVGLLCQPLNSKAYEDVVAGGRVPYLDVVDPQHTSPADRLRVALRLECEKWDEGMYLYVRILTQ